MATQSKKSKSEALVAQPTSEKGGQRQEAAKKRRDDRMKAYERNRRQILWTKIGAGVLALIVVAFIGYTIVNKVRDTDLNQIPDGVANYVYAAGQHDDNVSSWTESPPVGGVHNNQWQKCGYYDGVINPAMGVHTLEHGAVWITYRPDLPRDQKDKLKALAQGQDYILVSEYPGLTSPIVASSWGHQLKVENADATELQQFIRVFKNSQEYTPEYGATCSNGVDTTVG